MVTAGIPTSLPNFPSNMATFDNLYDSNCDAVATIHAIDSYDKVKYHIYLVFIYPLSLHVFSFLLKYLILSVYLIQAETPAERKQATASCTDTCSHLVQLQCPVQYRWRKTADTQNTAEAADKAADIVTSIATRAPDTAVEADTEADEAADAVTSIATRAPDTVVEADTEADEAADVVTNFVTKATHTVVTSIVTRATDTAVEADQAAAVEAPVAAAEAENLFCQVKDNRELSKLNFILCNLLEQANKQKDSLRNENEKLLNEIQKRENESRHCVDIAKEDGKETQKINSRWRRRERRRHICPTLSPTTPPTPPWFLFPPPGYEKPQQSALYPRGLGDLVYGINRPNNWPESKPDPVKKKTNCMMYFREQKPKIPVPDGLRGIMEIDNMRMKQHKRISESDISYSSTDHSYSHSDLSYSGEQSNDYDSF